MMADKRSSDAKNIWSERWSAHRARTEGLSRMMEYPAEQIIRLLKGNYVDNLPESYHKLKILDVGAGDGNNLGYFNKLGFDAYGTEINEFLVSKVKKLFKAKKIKATIKVGHNDNLPFENNMFDFLVSWNVIHYCDTEKAMNENIEEYSRVLKKDGFLFLSTWAPKHRVLENSKMIKENLVRINRKKNLRHNQIMYLFRTKQNLKKHFKINFKKISIGRNFIDMMGFDFFILVAQKE